VNVTIRLPLSTGTARSASIFLLKAVLGFCFALLLTSPGRAQGVNDVPPEPGNAAYNSKPAVTSGSPVTVTHHGLTENDLQPVEFAIQFALLVCGIWSVVSGIRPKNGANSALSTALGSLILIDVATFQNQLNWWMASAGDPFQPAFGLGLPGVFGGILFFVRAILQPKQGRPNRATLVLIAVAIIAVSISLSCLAWPQHPPSPQGFS